MIWQINFYADLAEELAGFANSVKPANCLSKNLYETDSLLQLKIYLKGGGLCYWYSTRTHRKPIGKKLTFMF